MTQFHTHPTPTRLAENLATWATVIACSATVIMVALLLLESFAIDSPVLPATVLYWSAVSAALIALGMAFLVTVREREIPSRAYVAIAAALAALLIAGTFIMKVANRVAL